MLKVTTMQRIDTLKKLVEPYYQNDDPGHDWLHIQRVAKNAFTIAKDLTLNTEYLLAGVYCHDLINVPKNHPDRSKASEFSADEAEKLLKTAGFGEQEIPVIRAIIIEHSFSKGLKPSSIEAAVLQDADRLDAIGATGILRCATTSVQLGSKLYHPEQPIAEDRALDDSAYMLDHYYRKLYLLPDLMNTDAAKNLAGKRIEFMKKFETELLDEIQ